MLIYLELFYLIEHLHKVQKSQSQTPISKSNRQTPISKPETFKGTRRNIFETSIQLYYWQAQLLCVVSYNALLACKPVRFFRRSRENVITEATEPQNKNWIFWPGQLGTRPGLPSERGWSGFTTYYVYALTNCMHLQTFDCGWVTLCGEPKNKINLVKWQLTHTFSI